MYTKVHNLTEERGMGVKMGGNKSLKSPEKGVLRQPRIYSGGNLGQLGKTKTKPKKTTSTT